MYLKGHTYEEYFGKEKALKLRKIRKLRTLQQHKEGRYKPAKQCKYCKCWLNKNHDCTLIIEKQKIAKLKNPTRYWLGKERYEETKKKISKKQKGKPHLWAQGKLNVKWKGSRSWYCREARKILSIKLKRKIKSTEIVHHIDGNWKNNNLKNLFITNRSEHVKIHHKQGDYL